MNVFNRNLLKKKEYLMYMNSIRIDGLKTGHIQGIAVDAERKYIYCSFTTCLIKADMDGNIIGSVRGLAGHLGCIAYNAEDGRVYGSLEYKHDSIGQGILKRLPTETALADGFYVAVFDVSKIDRMDMDAEKDGVMTAVYLEEVLSDYAADGHRYGCSGIDGLTFAPIPGNPGGKNYLYVAYGIYSDTARQDNDHQVLLRYDTDGWKALEQPLCQSRMHRQGPSTPDGKYFVYTGNTTYGIQNLEYDPSSRYMFAAVYRGKKAGFPNYPMYVIDMQSPASFGTLRGMEACGEQLRLADFGQRDPATGIFGVEFPYGATGMIALGDGHFYFSRDFSKEGVFGTDIGLYILDTADGFKEKE